MCPQSSEVLDPGAGGGSSSKEEMFVCWCASFPETRGTMIPSLSSLGRLSMQKAVTMIFGARHPSVTVKLLWDRDASAALEVASRHSCCQRHSFCSSSVMWWDAGREVWREGSEERRRRKRVEEGGLFL